MYKKFVTAFMLAVLSAISISTVHFTHRNNGPAAIAKAAESDKTELLQTRKEVVKAIRKDLLNRKSRIEVAFKDSVRKEINDLGELMEEVMAYDSDANAKDADYLEYSLTGWSVQMEWIKGRSASLMLEVSYKCTLKEEKELDKKAAGVLKALKLEKASDVKKVRAIHDYIVKRVNYDLTYEKASAYDALIGKSAVCEGYAMAAYLMFTQAGLDCKIIGGTADGEAHAWNIVKVDGKWYNIDLTWDDPITSDGTEMLMYDYYLKSTADFKDHKRDAAYRTDEFVKAHPIAKTSYAFN